RPAHAARRHGAHGLPAALRRALRPWPRRDARAAPRGAIRRGGCDGMRLLLARHGQTEWNADRRFQGHTDIALSERGRAQAHALGRALRGRRVTAAYVSPMRRAVETAEIALADAGIAYTPIEALRELSLGEWEGCT